MDAENETHLAYYKMKLKIEPSQIDRELMEHAPLYFDVSERYALAESRVAAAKEALARREAKIYQEAAAAPEGGKRPSEASLQHAVLLHPRRQAVWDAYQEAVFVAAQWRAMRDTFSSRSYALRDLCALQLAGHYQTQTVRGAGQSSKTAASERNMESLREQRKSGRSPLDD